MAIEELMRIELARLAYGEHIMRCNEQDPERIKYFLSLDGEENKAKKWLAFAIAKRQEDHDKDKIRGLLAYLFSNKMGEFNPQKRAWLIQKIERGELRLRDLTLEMLEGTRLEWEHIFKLVGKEFNPTREKERIKKIYEQLALEGL